MTKNRQERLPTHTQVASFRQLKKHIQELESKVTDRMDELEGFTNELGNSLVGAFAKPLWIRWNDHIINLAVVEYVRRVNTTVYLYFKDGQDVHFDLKEDTHTKSLEDKSDKDIYIETAKQVVEWMHSLLNQGNHMVADMNRSINELQVVPKAPIEVPATLPKPVPQTEEVTHDNGGVVVND